MDPRAALLVCQHSRPFPRGLFQKQERYLSGGHPQRGKVIRLRSSSSTIRRPNSRRFPVENESITVSPVDFPESPESTPHALGNRFFSILGLFDRSVNSVPAVPVECQARVNLWADPYRPSNYGCKSGYSSMIDIHAVHGGFRPYAPTLNPVNFGFLPPLGRTVTCQSWDEIRSGSSGSSVTAGTSPPVDFGSFITPDSPFSPSNE